MYYNLQKQHSTGSSGGGNGGGGVVVNSEGYSYVNDVPSIPSSHHRHSGQKSSSHREHGQQSRARRTQRRVTHNEKRYHSGQPKIQTSIMFILFCL